MGDRAVRADPRAADLADPVAPVASRADMNADLTRCRDADQPNSSSSRNRARACGLPNGWRSLLIKPLSTSTRRAEAWEMPLALAAALTEPVASNTATTAAGSTPRLTARVEPAGRRVARRIA